MRFKEGLYKVETDIRIREMDIESFQMFSWKKPTIFETFVK
jgi:hypothetical protein